MIDINKIMDIEDIKDYINTLELMLKEGEIHLNSKQIAELTNKTHKRVIEDIEHEMNKLATLDKSLLYDEPSGTPIFKLSNYVDEQNKERKLYILNKNGIYQILARYSPFVRRIIISRIDFLETVARLGGRDLSLEDVFDLHRMIKPILYYIYDIYSRLSIGEEEDTPLYNHLIEERDRWMSIFKDEDKFKEWLENLHKHYQDVDIWSQLLNKD